MLYAAALAFARLASHARAKAAFQAGVIFRFFLGFSTAFPLAAHLFATPARIFANPSALILRFFFGAGPADGAVPLIAAHLAN